ncbi:MAG: ATP-binding protein [Pseudomonadota bacterium]
MAAPTPSATQQGNISSRLPALVQVCGLLAAAIGLAALIGWLAGIPLLTAFGSGQIPMAPSTAFFFLFYGAGSLFLFPSRPEQTARWGPIGLNAAAVMTTGLLFVLSMQGIHPTSEHLGFLMAGTVDGAPIGHMSPLTAFCFILIGTAFLLALSATPKHFWPTTAAFWCAASVSLISTALLLAYLLGAPLLYGSGAIPPALSTALALLLLGVSIQLAVWLRSSTRLLRVVDSRAPYHLLLIFALLAGGIVLSGFLSFQKYEKEYRLGMGQQLSAIVALKATRIADWLAERRADATELASNRNFVGRVDKWLSNGAENERENIVFRLESIRLSHGYEGIALLDADDRLMLQQGDPVKIAKPVTDAAARARTDGRVTRSDLYRDSTGRIHLVWVAPIMTARENGLQPVAAVLFSTEAESFLFPFIEEWPTASRSAETLLVRRDGNEVLFLNNLRFRKDAALRLRIPLADREVPAVQAALGREGIVAGRDYRGIPVMAALKAVTGSPWFLVARMDMAEIHAPLRDRLWSRILVILALLIGTAAMLILQWQRQQHDLLAQVAEKDRRLAVELEKRVAERTAQLDAANKELESFSYSVSHDLKAPLRGIDGYSRLLEEGYRDGLTAEGRQFLANIRRGVAQMHQLIEDLLAYSRLERRTLHNAPVDLPALVRAMVAEAETEISGTEATLRLKVPALSLCVDHGGLAMALRNLLDNARKFSRGSQPPIIEIGARTENDTILLWVRDNGIGFEQKFHERIFEIFSRLERAEDFPGTGVGLALVRKAMQRMGGRVWAESAPGQGAVFYLELPMTEPPLSSPATERQGSQTDPSTRRKTP